MPVGEALAVAEALNAEPAADFIAPNRKLALGAPDKLDFLALCGPVSAYTSVDVLLSVFQPLV